MACILANNNSADAVLMPTTVLRRPPPPKHAHRSTWKAHMKPWQNLERRPQSSEKHGRPNEKDIFSVVGAALLTCQIAERLLKFYLINFIPKVNPKTLEKLFSHRSRFARRRWASCSSSCASG